MKLKSLFIKITQWEHWPTFMFYIPIIPFYLLKVFKARSFTFYLITNPAIRYSGDGSESKYKTICLVPKKYQPKSLLFGKFEDFSKVIKTIKEAKIDFPLIAKPDIGFRGFLVKKINSEKELKIYFQKNNSIEILVQEFVAYKNECGILYHRLPNDKKGKITSITLKKFLTVIGDGKSTLSELILADKRAFLYYDLLQNIHQEKMRKILQNDKKLTLTVIGNHSKGTQFLNGNHLICKELEETFDELNKQIPGWYFGRLDIKYNNFKKLKKGEDFKILEINGIISEPTHIYDPSIKDATYIKALKTIKKNWNVINNIAHQNKKNLNIPYPKFFKYINEMKKLRIHSRKLKRLNKTN